MPSNDSIQDLFDRALRSIPDQPVPSPSTLHQRVGRGRADSHVSALASRARAVFSFRARRGSPLLRSSLVLIALAVVCVAALTAVVLATDGSIAPKTSASRNASIPLDWRLVSSNGSPFRSLTPGGTVGLQCVTDTVCYSPGADQDNFYSTTDGGLSWEQTAPLPISVSGQGWVLQSFSCPTAETCAILFVPVGASNGTQLAQLVLSTDGGAHWSASQIPSPTGFLDPSVGRFVCGDASHCLVSVSGEGPSVGGVSTSSQRVGTFLSTANAGQTWTQATSAPSGPAAGVWTLNCDTDGSCIAISAVEGSQKGSNVVAIHSDDWGWTWQAGSQLVSKYTGVLYASCGDPMDCVFISESPYQIAATSDAGATWKVSTPPVNWENMPTAISCANGDDCWIATSIYGLHNPAGTYSDPVIEATTDGGTYWSTVPLPSHRPAIGDVLTLSCPPSGDGCMGIGQLSDHFSLPPPTSTPARQSGPLVISNLPEQNQST